MYNRYLRNDQGKYTCVRQEEPRRSAQREPFDTGGAPPRRDVPPPPPPPGDDEKPGGAFEDGFRFLNGILEKLHLQDLDGADLMLLLLLFFLFEEKADDELLIALGLLLIL